MTHDTYCTNIFKSRFLLLCLGTNNNILQDELLLKFFAN